MNVMDFLRSIFKKTPSVYILKPRREIGQSLEEVYEEVSLLRTL